MKHFIRQQFLNVDLKGSESDGFVLQHHLSDFYYAQLLPAIEKALDQCSSPDNYLVIDRLDIDAGTIELDKIDHELATSVSKALIQRIGKESATGIPGNKIIPPVTIFPIGKEVHKGSYYLSTEENLWNVFIYFLEKGYLPWSYRLPEGNSLEEVITELLINDGIKSHKQIPTERISEVLKSANTRKRLVLQFSEHFNKLLFQNTSMDNSGIQVDTPDRDKQINLWEVFIYFLLNGSLPKYYKLETEKSLEEALTELLDEDETRTPVPVSKITEALKSPYAAKRLIFQFSELFIIKLLKRICPETLTELTSLLAVSENSSFAPGEVRLLRKFVLEKALVQASSCGSISKVDIARQVYEELQISTDLLPLVAKVFEQTWPEIKISENETPIIRSEQSPSDQVVKTENTQLDSEVAKPFQSDDVKTKNEASSTDTRIEKELVTMETVEGIYIDNAGLVLLHPFFPRFFDSLGISIEEVIVQPERALSLLHYLTTGQTKIPEYELILPKILCEFPLLMPVSSDYKITENEISEVAALLDAVIKHWEVLRNTTPDGLRGTFLLRPGKLIRKEDGDWLLQVESRTFDVLLEHLPWGISMIKLPWMKKMLWVEWIF